jgi:glycosyltransferase involved in cell wall biosynthesis
MDVVWFAEIKWDYLRTRKQQLVRRRPEDVRLLYLEPYVRGRENRFALRETEGIGVATVPFVKAVPGGPARRLVDLGWVRRAIDARALARARRLSRQAGMPAERAVAVLSNVYAVAVARRFGARLLAYDCNDAHGDFPGMPPWTQDYFTDACRAAQAVFVTARALGERVEAVRGGSAGVETIGNGVEFARFDAVRRALGPGGGDGRVRVGYVGAIAPWLDVALLARVARERPDWEVVLVGPQMLGVDLSPLRGLSNVVLRPPVAYEEVPRVLHDFTLGVIPFRYDALTRGVNPNKMYEYLAMGLPVVATAFSHEVTRYPEVVHAAQSADDFLRACDDFVALCADDERAGAFSARAAAAAARHDWAEIAARFWSRLRALAETVG